MSTTTFNGRRYRVEPVSSDNRIRVLSAARSGCLDHLGSLREPLLPGCSAFQVYSAGAALLAAAVSCSSQHIDVAYFLFPS
jgi:hypothetical protein